MNSNEKAPKPQQTTKEDIDRSDWEGMGQQRFQPDEKPSPSQVKEENKKKGPTPGSNALAGQIQK